jgi:DNA-binding NarL/FixJ family response regulator
LTPRELDVLQQRALLGRNAAVAKELNISVETVETHLRSIRKSCRLTIPQLRFLKLISTD